MSNKVNTPKVAGHQFLYTTPELREKRQEAVKKYVDRYYVQEDKDARQALAAIGTTATATLAAGVIAGTQFHGELSTPPSLQGAQGNAGAPAATVVVGQIANDDTVGQIAEKQVQASYHRQDGKKADTFKEATPAFRFRAGLGRPTEAQLQQMVRLDNAARVNNHDREGQEVSGRGSGTQLFGRYYQAPEIPDVANFRPVNQ